MEEVKEKISLQDKNDKDSWKCLCGNTPTDHGFYPCNEIGIEVEPTPEAWKTNMYVCYKCGRYFDMDTLEVEGIRAI